jgi:hypothetical protein
MLHSCAERGCVDAADGCAPRRRHSSIIDLPLPLPTPPPPLPPLPPARLPPPPLQVARLRDACMSLAGHRPQREYPMDWVESHLRSSGYAVAAARRLPILYGEGSLQRQLDMASRRLAYIADRCSFPSCLYVGSCALLLRILIVCDARTCAGGPTRHRVGNPIFCQVAVQLLFVCVAPARCGCLA